MAKRRHVPISRQGNLRGYMRTSLMAKFRVSERLACAVVRPERRAELPSFCHFQMQIFRKGPASRQSGPNRQRNLQARSIEPCFGGNDPRLFESALMLDWSNRVENRRIGPGCAGVRQANTDQHRTCGLTRPSLRISLSFSLEPRAAGCRWRLFTSRLTLSLRDIFLPFVKI